MGKSSEWIEEKREVLRKKYPDKVIIICECKVIKTFDTSVEIHEIFEQADKLCKGKDWAWADLPARESEMIL